MSVPAAIKAVLWTVFTMAVPFVAAGTLRWPGGWAYVAEFVLCSALLTLWLARRDPGLLKERMGGVFQEGQSLSDKIFMGLMIVLWYGWMVLMAFDARRWHWSSMPTALQVLGGVLIPAGYFIIWLTFRANTFAAPVVKIQAERGQHVVSTGPYAIVRHPMYAGAIIYLLGTPLLLGSWYGLATLPLLVAALCLRIRIEEATLREGLAGYGAYAARVRWRVVPGVW